MNEINRGLTINRLLKANAGDLRVDGEGNSRSRLKPGESMDSDYWGLDGARRSVRLHTDWLLKHFK